MTADQQVRRMREVRRANIMRQPHFWLRVLARVDAAGASTCVDEGRRWRSVLCAEHLLCLGWGTCSIEEFELGRIAAREAREDEAEFERANAAAKAKREARWKAQRRADRAKRAKVKEAFREDRMDGPPVDALLDRIAAATGGKDDVL